MAKTIPFNIRLKIDGKDVVVSCRHDVEKLGEALSGATRQSERLGASAGSLLPLVQTAKNLYGSLQGLAGAMSPYIEKANAAADAQTRLATVMRQRMASTAEDTAAINAAVAAQSQLGVVGGTVQRMGLQQLATFASYKSTLTALLPAMNNLLTQQKGLSATGQDAVGVANLLGKALQGQTSALRRVGITFSEAQEKAIKAGSEGERAAMIAEVITQNVGNMNAELAKTDAGKVKQLSNSFGGMLTKIGAMLSPYQEAIAIFGQMGMAVSGMFQFGSSLVGVGKAAADAAGKLGFLVTTSGLWKRSAVGLSAMATALQGSLTGAAVGATTLRVAMAALQTATAVGVAVAALSAIVYGAGKAFSYSKDMQTGHTAALEASKRASESLTKKLREVNDQVAQNRAQLIQDIAATKDWHGTKAQEKAMVEQLNARYGETMGYFSSVAQWYQALTANSEAYCQQLVNEARMRALANQIAENDQAIHDLYYNADGSKKSLSGQQQTMATQNPVAYGMLASEGYDVDVFHEKIKGTSEKEKTAARAAALRAQNKALKKQMQGLTRPVKMPKQGAVTPPTGGAAIHPSKPSKVGAPRGASSGVGSAVVDKPSITDGISSMEQLDEKVRQLYDDLSNLPAGNIKKALEIQGNLDELEQYRKKLEQIADSRRALMLQGDMAVIGGNTPGNTAAADLAGMVLPKQPAAPGKAKGVTGADIVAGIELRNTAAEDLQRQIETVVNAVNAGELGSEMGEALVDGLNKQLEGLGKHGMGFDALMKQSDNAREKMQGVCDAVSRVGSSLSNAGSAFQLPALDIMGTVAQAIATMVLGYAQATQQAAKLGPWAWIAFAATGLAELTAIISSIHGATGYATGGIVGGSSFSGDRIPVRVNSGEMILTRWQQQRLFDIANGGSVPVSSSVSPRLDTGRLQLQPLRVEVSGRLTGRGRQLVAVIGNEGKARGSAGWKLPWG